MVHDDAQRQAGTPGCQLVMGTVFGTMGLGTMLLPQMVGRTCFTAEFLGDNGVSPMNK